MPGRIETTGIGDDLDALLRTGRDHIAQLLEEGAHIACVATTALLLVVENGHGEFGEIITGEHIDRPAFDHLQRRRQLVAIEAAAVGYPQYLAHRFPQKNTCPVRSVLIQQSATQNVPVIGRGPGTPPGRAMTLPCSHAT